MNRKEEMNTNPTDLDDPQTPRPRRRWSRAVLMFMLPLALLTGGGYAWLTGGRYVTTENASVGQDRITVAAEVTGRIMAVAVHENEMVAPDQVLFRIDDEPFRFALQRANAEIASARLKVEQLRSVYHAGLASRRAAKQNLSFRQREFARQKTLAKSGNAAQAKFDAARHEWQAAGQRLAVSEQEVNSALAALMGDPDIATERHPYVLEALAHRDGAALDVEHTTVRSPIAGIVTHTARLQVGQFFPAGSPVMSMVETRNTWIEANIKETELTYMAVGQAATVELDAYPGRTLTATVESIGAGTGAEFSILPAQNATGNWVKVVQRVPVRLKLDMPPPGLTLRAGLSAAISIDTGHTRGLPSPIRSALAMTGIVAAKTP